MMKVKVLESGSADSLEDKINKFLSEISNPENIIDIKYRTNMIEHFKEVDGRSYVENKLFSVLIYYIESSGEPRVRTL